MLYFEANMYSFGVAVDADVVLELLDPVAASDVSAGSRGLIRSEDEAFVAESVDVGMAGSGADMGDIVFAPNVYVKVEESTV